MNKKLTSLMLLSALLATGVGSWAESTNATGNNNDPLKHPVNAYTNHEVKEDMKDSQEYSQRAAEAKATHEEAAASYEKSLKENGANSDVTKEAKKRMQNSRKDMNKFNKKAAHANKELREDQIKAHQ